MNLGVQVAAGFEALHHQKTSGTMVVVYGGGGLMVWAVTKAGASFLKRVDSSVKHRFSQHACHSPPPTVALKFK